ncbi:MAG: hypothetical protein ACRD0P_08425, partial [Stackebrandtia sp.]
MSSTLDSSDVIASMTRAFGEPQHTDYLPAELDNQTLLKWSEIHRYATFEGAATVFEMSAVARTAGDYIPLIERANFAGLTRDNTDVFIAIAYSNCKALAIAAHRLTTDIAEVLVALVEDYPSYDDSLMSDMEHKAVEAAWDQFLHHDVARDLEDNHGVSADVLDAITADELRELFYA